MEIVTSSIVYCVACSIRNPPPLRGGFIDQEIIDTITFS